MFSLKCIKFLMLTVLCGVSLAVDDIPADFPHCSKDDPKLNDCLLKATETIKPQLIKGLPGIFPSIESFPVDEISLNQDTKALNFKATLKNVILKGLSNYKFEKLEFDPVKLIGIGSFSISPVDLVGNYQIDGKILVTPIKGNGKITGTLDNLHVDYTQTLEIVQRKGTEFLNTKQVKVHLKAHKPKLHLDGLFNNDAELGKITNQVIADNIDDLFEDLRPSLEKIIEKLIEESIFNGIEKKIPYNKLF